MQEKLATFQSHINDVEKENTKLRNIEKSWREAEETLKLQNRSMKDMQMKLQQKNDEIERLREELEDSQRFFNSGQNEMLEEKVCWPFCNFCLFILYYIIVHYDNTVFSFYLQ